MPAQELRDAALAAAARGWFVFPLRPGAKTPAVEHWPQQASTDPIEIREWWAHNPAYNIAVATEPSGLLVIDLDTLDHRAARGADPASWQLLADLAAAAHATRSLFTYTVATPSGGRHLYYRVGDGEAPSCTVGRLGAGIDSRGRGGYIVAAESRTTAGSYRILDPRPARQLPAWLRHQLQSSPSPPAHGPVEPPHQPGRYLTAILTSELHTVTAARVGTRNHSLFRAAFTLGRLVAGGELDEHDTRRALVTAAARHIGTDGFTAVEVERTITSAFKLGADRPRRIDSSAISSDPAQV
ncbi:bifunctional DNA primase/polymerase [Nocardia sp. NPDC051832]|uniref:bifunctional DNA primase/polymerase n=1 Tax=Nocardia sp. NPDC051832 TaxID=3155673 RepID=UPI003429BB54